MPSQTDQQKSLSKQLAKKITEQKATIRENARFLKEQQSLIDSTIEIGNNHILQLTTEADKIKDDIEQAKADYVEIAAKVDNMRFELIMLGKA